MGHGRLRVYLGAAPGVGTTYRMLEEGNRRRARGADVVVGFVDTHGRPHTIEQLRGLEVVATRGADGREMDVDALLARRPGVVLVDDLAERHAETSRYATRWDEVTALRDAGIDVLATLDVAHLDSAQPIVTQIAGLPSRVTIDDALVRGADQVELVDITPEALRRRLAHGNIYQVDTVDASVSNYFRAENLATLRQVAVRWISDYIEASLQSYREDHSPRERERRERIVVGVRGSASDALLLERCAASAARTNADVIAVHVIPLARNRQGISDLGVTRRLVEECGAQFQEIADDDVATALVAFAQSERATQLVVGESRRFAGTRASGVAATIVSRSRGLDVHVVSVEGDEPIRLRRRQKSHLSWRRRAAALVAAALGLPGVTIALTSLHSNAVLSVVFPVYLAAVIGLTVWGGPLIGVASSIAASFLENYYFIAPRHTFVIARADDLTALVAFLAFSIGASIVVSAFTRRSIEAERARAEAEILTKAAATVATTHDDLQPILDSLRVIFDLSRVELVTKFDDAWVPELTSGAEDAGDLSAELTIDSAHILRVYGTALDAHDRAMLTVFLGRVAVGLRSQQFEREASAMRALAEADALRTSLLRAVSHDLRTPLATIEANVSTLLAQDITWSSSDQRAFLTVIEREVHRLTRLVTNLLDAGRLEAGVVTSRLVSVEIDDLVASALETIDTLGRTLKIEIPENLPSVVTDPDLYERVIANIIANACRFSPAEQPVTIRAGVDAKYMDLLVIDRGPGVDPAMVERIKAPFQRLGDDASGAGLGLTVANGFIELLGGSIRMEDTPGGGLTVVVAIPVTAER
ncbi:MAG: sensor histidine kinase KdpD [Acidobacteriota bacterium]|nr:sensor histidine kinase KdpD [Acidobacteriota bacterium]